MGHFFLYELKPMELNLLKLAGFFFRSNIINDWMMKRGVKVVIVTVIGLTEFSIKIFSISLQLS